MLIELNKSKKNCIIFSRQPTPLNTFSADGIFCVYRYFIILFLTFHQGLSVRRICPNTCKTTTRMTSSTISTWTEKRWRIPPASVLPPVRAASRLETPSTASRATTTTWRHKIIPQTNSVFTVTGWTINQVFKTHLCDFFHDKSNYQPALLRSITGNVYSTKRKLSDWIYSLKKLTSYPSSFCGIFLFDLLRRTISALTTTFQLFTPKCTALFRYRVFFQYFSCVLSHVFYVQKSNRIPTAAAPRTAQFRWLFRTWDEPFTATDHILPPVEIRFAIFSQAARFCQDSRISQSYPCLFRSELVECRQYAATPRTTKPRGKAGKSQEPQQTRFVFVFSKKFSRFFPYAPIDRVWLKWIFCLLLQVLGAIIYGNSFGIYWRTPSSETKSSSGRTRKRAFFASSSQKRSPKCGERKNAIRGWRMRSFPERWGEFVHLMCFV